VRQRCDILLSDIISSECVHNSVFLTLPTFPWPRSLYSFFTNHEKPYSVHGIFCQLDDSQINEPASSRQREDVSGHHSFTVGRGSQVVATTGAECTEICQTRSRDKNRPVCLLFPSRNAPHTGALYSESCVGALSIATDAKRPHFRHFTASAVALSHGVF